MKALKVVLPSAVSDNSLRKLEHYCGIEFERGASNGGGDNGYHAMIGDETLLKEMRFHNMIKIAMVKNAKPTAYLNQINWTKTENNTNSITNGSDGSDILQVFPTMYAILGGTNPTYERFIVSDQEFSYDGDEAIEIKFHGETPDYETIINGVSRCVFDSTAAGSQGAGQGKNYSDNGFGNTNALGFPKTSMSRYAYESAARAKNSNSNSNVPYTNIYTGDLEFVRALLYIECRTKNLNNVFGHGISCNVIPTAETWGKVTGLRLTKDSGSTYTYCSFGSQIYVNGVVGNLWNAVNNSNPLLKIFESQLDVSTNGSRNFEAVYDSDGNKLNGLSEGVMTGIFTKTMSFDIENMSFTSDGKRATYHVEVCLRQPVWRGRNRLWGHLWQHYSGYEVLNWTDGSKYHNTIYRAKSVEDLTVDSIDAVQTDKNAYPFVSSYEEVTDLGFTPGWMKNEINHKGISLAVAKDDGATMNNYESCYIWFNNDTPQGSFAHRCSLFGGSATDGFDVLRFCLVFSAPSSASSDLGSGFRATLSE